MAGNYNVPDLHMASRFHEQPVRVGGAGVAAAQVQHPVKACTRPSIQMLLFNLFTHLLSKAALKLGFSRAGPCAVSQLTDRHAAQHPERRPLSCREQKHCSNIMQTLVIIYITPMLTDNRCQHCLQLLPLCIPLFVWPTWKHLTINPRNSPRLYIIHIIQAEARCKAQYFNDCMLSFCGRISSGWVSRYMGYKASKRALSAAQLSEQ